MAKNKNKNENGKVYIVESPVKNFCGINAGGVHFAYGKAEVHEGWVLEWYRKHGYKITEKTNDKVKDEPNESEGNADTE